MNNSFALERLAEIRHALDRGLITPTEATFRATQVLDRATLKPLDLVAYLEARGYEGSRLAKAIGPFSRAVRAGYEETYGTPPLHRQELIRGLWVRVMAYIEEDRPIVDEVYERLFSVIDKALEGAS
ncbi:hypothetical protein [Lysinibacter sp. HNR]|uniref:hypothetical protein n=1 Tax=Lysinibacter sp. HNR TaxID=3031408 RepID=UPI002434B69B|nr:hypothetical protein [Lysinibacter sp. HNR]WGD38502.1 hypothetical protein FrondiHNR_06215 [Lysinibacter sp. HNR]